MGDERKRERKKKSLIGVKGPSNLFLHFPFPFVFLFISAIPRSHCFLPRPLLPQSRLQQGDAGKK